MEYNSQIITNIYLSVFKQTDRQGDKDAGRQRDRETKRKIDRDKLTEKKETGRQREKRDGKK